MKLEKLKPFTCNATVVFLGLLLIADAVFITAHLTRVYLGEPEHAMFKIDHDHGHAEIFQYIKEMWAALMLFALSIRQRGYLHLSWALLFGYLLLDDSLELHESLGEAFVIKFGLSPAFGLRAQDFGELAVTAVCASLLLSMIGISHYLADSAGRLISRHLAILVMFLAFFGVIIDMLHSILSWGSTFWTIVEEGGEMVVMSFIVSYVLQLCLYASHRSSKVEHV